MTRRPQLATIARASRAARIAAAVSLVVALSAFVASFSLLSLDYDAGGRLAELERRGELVPLPRWDVRDAACRDEENGAPACLEIGDPREEVLPLKQPDAKADADARRAGHVVLSMELTEPLRAWLTARPRAVLLVARQAHNETWARAGGRSLHAVGMGNDVALHFRTADLLGSGTRAIELVIDRAGLPWYGPADIPPVLVTPDALPLAQSLATRLRFASDLQSQLEIGFPLLFAGVALVLDHSPVFALASAYGTLRALRAAFVAHLLHEKIAFEAAWPFLYAGLNAACALALAATAWVLTGGRLRGRAGHVAAGLALLVVGTFLFAQARVPEFEIVADLWADAAGAAAGLALCAFNAARFFRKEATLSQDAPAFGATSKATGIVVGTLVIAGLALHGWVNAQELLGSGGGPSRNPLDWRHVMLFPLLLTASLASVGSLARRMTLFARRIAHDALVAKEVSLARELHGRTLPPRAGGERPHAWRLFHVPASTLAGDWVDARHVTLSDGTRLLLACVVDVTGHGLGAALVTGAICAQWRFWCRTLDGLPREEYEATKETRLAGAALALHGALLAVGREDTCTAVFLAHDPKAGELVYLTCGHPGILHARAEGRVDYLKTTASGLGHAFLPEPDRAGLRSKIARTSPGDVIALYSDGLVPPSESLTSWVRRVQKGVGKSAPPFARTLASQVRANRAAFRADRSSEDDVTLLLVALDRDTTASEQAGRTGSLG